jgi:AcrR family transcriptional regulator
MLLLSNHLDILELIFYLLFYMGRKAYFKHEEFLNAAIEIIAEEGLGALTIAALAKRIKAPVGSVYHRFPSRDALLAELWLNIIESFQNEFLQKLQEDGLQATLSCLQWVRTHPYEARIMLLYRIDDIMSGEWPQELQKRAERLARELHRAVLQFTKKQFGRVTKENADRVAFALHDAPIGIFRRYLQNNKIPPESVADLIRETYKAIIENTK